MSPQDGERAASAQDGGWRRLSPRLLLVNLGMLSGPLALFALTLLLTGADLQALISLGSMLTTFLVITWIGTMRLLTTRFRVVDGRVEMRSGLLFRSHRSLPVDRIRSVDIHAKPSHRIFGLASVRIGTGGQGSPSGRELRLGGITRSHADDLRRLLLDPHGRTGAGPGTPGPGGEGDGLVAELDWAWLRYAPLSLWGLGAVLVGVGTVARVLGEMKINPLDLAVVVYVRDRFGSVPWWFGILVTAVALLVIGAALSTAAFVEGWSGYRLEREGDDAYRVHRGLLVHRSVTLEHRRLRGVEIIEPMPLRRAGAARLDAIAGGLGSSEENRSRRSLTPAVPRQEALRVAADVLAEERSPTETAQFLAHPRVALCRRINRGLLVLAPLVAVLLGLGPWLGPAAVHAAWITAFLGVPVVLALAHDAYRALGHGLRDRYLVVRAGTFARRTAAVQRDGVIGWRITRSAFQRRKGLLTLGATIAAGDGCYKVRDVGVTDGIALAEEVVPGLLTPFLERGPEGGAGPRGEGTSTGNGRRS
ncbi:MULTISPECIES: PH domain-containing protein [unclassified Streptomyces]|uniref:PH domain-containing protein n=1 Tax=unclassified Streptomyces TaxID=2593676 RepID=UPI003810CDBD